MKDDIFNLLPNSEDIIKNKNFSELSRAEQSQFLEYLTVEEYESIRQNLLMIKSVFKKEEGDFLPGNEIKNKLLSIFPQKVTRKHKHFYYTVIQLLNIKIPAYQIAIILIIGIILFIKIKNTGSAYHISGLNVDTVYVERIVNVPRQNENNINTAKKNKNENFRAKKTFVKNNSASTDNYKTEKQNVILNQNLSILINNINLAQNTKTGRTLENDKDIYKILISAQ